MSTVTLHIGDVFDVMRLFAPQGIDLIVTSPPFLALRSYLPADHPDKQHEIGSEATPAAFLDTLLALTAEWRRVLAPHGSLCVELGDTYSGSALGFKDGDKTWRPKSEHSDGRWSGRDKCGPGWPLSKSLTGIPTLYTWSLAYGRNLLTDHPSPAGQWRIRNLLVWARPNPPVGALGDKFRPACSYITVACVGARRWFDLDAVRTDERPHGGRGPNSAIVNGAPRTSVENIETNPAGAPPLDWHYDGDDGPTGDRLWQMPTQPYSGAHYATYPLELPRRLIDAMCPREVCRVCGKARERITGAADYVPSATYRGEGRTKDHPGRFASMQFDGASRIRTAPTLGWSDCGHDNYRTGRVLDPFLGSGTTAVAAAELGRDCIGIDLDDRNTGLVHQRLREKVHIVDTNYRADRMVSAERPDTSGWAGYDKGDCDSGPHYYRKAPEDRLVPVTDATTVVWHCDAPLPDQTDQIEGQTNLFDYIPETLEDVDTGGHL